MGGKLQSKGGVSVQWGCEEKGLSRDGWVGYVSFRFQFYLVWFFSLRLVPHTLAIVHTSFKLRVIALISWIWNSVELFLCIAFSFSLGKVTHYYVECNISEDWCALLAVMYCVFVIV